MATMESPNKRVKLSPPGDFNTNEDSVSFGQDQSDGFSNNEPPENAPKHPRNGVSSGGQKWRDNQFDPRKDPRHAKDKPKSKHLLPGNEPWILVKTKFGRRFVHNTHTRESFWRIPSEIILAVRGFDSLQAEQKEKNANAKWAEEQLVEMRAKSNVEEFNRAADQEARAGSGRRRRRSESLQREDEAAMLAELAAEAEKGEEEDARAAVKAVEDMKPQGYLGEASDSEYEYVEVTDTEGEGEEEDDGVVQTIIPTGSSIRPEDQQEDMIMEAPEGEEAAHEFGEDDIAYQLAVMGADYGLEAGDYDPGDNTGAEEHWEDGEDEFGLTENDAQLLFREMLDDHHVSPFMPWERLIEDDSNDGILMDDRYTVLTSSKARKDAWSIWSKDKAAQIREERAQMEKQDPKIPYLAFLAETASPKLYWPEFKRKHKKEAAMNERRFPEKDRERLYRDHITRLKLPESTRKADFISLMKNIPLSALNRDSRLESLPSQLLSHLHSISLPVAIRDRLITSHIASLPSAPNAADGEQSEEQRAAEEKRRTERRRREAALAEREKRVEEDRRKADKEKKHARWELRQGEREIERAMHVEKKSNVE